MLLITDGKKRHEEKSGIYLIINKINGKQYIGQSIRVYERWREHYSEPSQNSLIDAAIQKYGVSNFEVWLLEECLPADLNIKEAFYADQYPDCYIPNGYNIAKCGEQNRITTKFKEVSCYDMNGSLIKTFECINDASRYYNLADTNICACCKRKIGSITAGGMLWSYGHQENIVITKPKTGRYGGKTVYQYNKDTGEFIQSFNSLTDAERYLSKPGGNKNISANCNKKLKSAYGFIWSYEKMENIL